MKVLRLLPIILIAGRLVATAHGTDVRFRPILPASQEFLSNTAIRSLHLIPSYPQALVAGGMVEGQTSEMTGGLVSEDNGASKDQSDSSGKQSSPLLDRRDRVFYPGDTERVKP